jgi:hypothetical protein
MKTIKRLVDSITGVPRPSGTIKGTVDICLILKVYKLMSIVIDINEEVKQ